MLTKTLSLERALLALVIIAVMLYVFNVPAAQLIFWSIYSAIAVFAVNYMMKAKEQKAISFCVGGFYLSMLGFVLGIVAIVFNWQLAGSIMAGSFFAFMGNFIAHSILVAPLIPDDELV